MCNCITIETTEKEASFDTYQSLLIAVDIAAITDNYLEILSVLNSLERESIKPKYGNKTSVKNRAAELARLIVIAILVHGDNSGRIKKRISDVFTKRGFRTQDSANGVLYTLNVDYTVNEVVLSGNSNKFARYVLNAALANADGVEAFNFSTNGRAGWSSYIEAVQRVMRNAEAAISDSDNPESFAALFVGYLGSLLK